MLERPVVSKTALTALLLAAILVGAGYLRCVGLDWDAGQHLHPDERFLAQVESALAPAASVREYFDTSHSPLNPNNRGYGFFVYGDFPIIVVRYLAEWLGQVGYDQVNLIGRQVSALSDLLTIFVLYLIATRLYDRRVALLGAVTEAARAGGASRSGSSGSWRPGTRTPTSRASPPRSTPRAPSSTWTSTGPRRRRSRYQQMPPRSSERRRSSPALRSSRRAPP